MFTDFVAILPSIVMMPVYGFFMFGIFGKHTGNAVGKPCIANAVEFHPLDFKTEKDIEEYLLLPGAMNVSYQFETVIRLGYYINSAIILYFILKRIFCGARNPYNWIFPIIHLSGQFMFVWMIWVRFEFQGRVCSGDYEDYRSSSSDKVMHDTDYSDYFMKQTGDFFWWYPVLIFSTFLCCTSCCLFSLWTVNSYSMKSVMDPMIQIKKSREKWESFMKEEAQRQFAENSEKFTKEHWQKAAEDFVNVFMTDE